MPIQYSILPGYQLGYFRYSGPLRDQHKLTSLLEFSAEPLARQLNRFLFDLSRIDHIELTFPNVLNLLHQQASFLARRGRRCQVALYAPNPVSLQLGHLFWSVWQPMQLLQMDLAEDLAPLADFLDLPPQVPRELAALSCDELKLQCPGSLRGPKHVVSSRGPRRFGMGDAAAPPPQAAAGRCSCGRQTGLEPVAVCQCMVE